MTLLVGYRHTHPTEKGDAGILLHDFRVTRTGPGGDRQQMDRLSKWDFFKDRDDVQAAYMVSGSVQFWRFAHAYVSSSMQDVDLENVHSIGAPLQESLLQAALDYPDHARSQGRDHEPENPGAIGVCFDMPRDDVRFFLVEGSTGNGAAVYPVEPGSVVVAGSGANAPQMRERLNLAAARAREAFGDDLVRIGQAIRNEALATIEFSGGSAFAKLGVSPVMGMWAVEGARLNFLSEHIVGGRSVRRVWYPSSYRLSMDGDQNVVLTDEVSGSESLTSSDVISDQDGASLSTIDPDNRELATDVSGHFPEEDHVYQFLQSVTRGMTFSQKDLADLASMGLSTLVEQANDPGGAWFAKHVVLRRLSRISFVGRYRLQETETLAIKVEYVDSDEEVAGVREVETYFALSDDQSQVIEREVTPDSLFDEGWVRTWVAPQP